MEGLPGGSIPDHSCFALIRDPQSSYLPGIDGALLESFTESPELGLPDFRGIVFHPAGLRKNLSELTGVRRHLIPFFIEEDGA